jgi:arsenate reductase-like glutaredoxin family protein
MIIIEWSDNEIMSEDNSKKMTKNALHRFCIEYESYKKSKSSPDEDTIRKMLMKHNETFLDIIVEHGDLLPPQLKGDIRDLYDRLIDEINTPTSVESILNRRIKT